jgi:segregation and condensation protein B
MLNPDFLLGYRDCFLDGRRFSMSLMTLEKMQAIIEAALMVAGQPLSVSSIQNLFPEDERPSSSDIKNILSLLKERYQDPSSGIELQEVANGYRYQAKSELSPWLARLWEERSPRYSRALLETLVIIAYKQPVTRAEIEEIRGVTVSTSIMKTLQEREWTRVVGYRDLPGKPAIYATTKDFLDYFNLKNLSDLPTLADIKNLDAQETQLQVQLAMENSNIGPGDSEVIPEEREAFSHDDNNVVAINDSIDLHRISNEETETNSDEFATTETITSDSDVQEDKQETTEKSSDDALATG